jgi:hemolysin III
MNIAHEPHSFREELWSALTHGLGAVVSLGAGAVLITLAALWGNGWQLGSAIVFGVSLLMLYVASTLYHAIPHPPAKARLKVFDHCAIFVLIAGTYTPFTLISLREHGGWWLFAAIWTIALIGVVFKLFFTGRFKGLSTLIYIGMGWIVMFAIKPLLQQVDTATIVWLFSGGIAYTAGTLFYMSRRIPYAHAIWHVFVLAGSVCHFVAVSMQVLDANVGAA